MKLVDLKEYEDQFRKWAREDLEKVVQNFLARKRKFA